MRPGPAPRRLRLLPIGWAPALALGAALTACTVVWDGPADVLPRDDGGAPAADAAADAGRDAGGGGGDVPAGPDAAPDVPSPIPDVRPPRDVAPPLDGPRPPDALRDVAPDAEPDRDAQPEPDLPRLRYCPWALTELPLVQRSGLFRAQDFAAATASPAPTDRACDMGLFPDRDRPERVWALFPDAPARLVVRSRCAGWDCDAVLIADDCIVPNVAACVTAEGDLRLDAPLAPGLSLLQMEARVGSEPGPFDLLLALNYDTGRDPCPVTGEVRLSELAALGDCTVDGGGAGVRTIVLAGDTAAPDAQDDVFVDCRGAGIDRDSVGGAPDRIWRIVADAPDAAPRRLGAAVTAPAAAWQPVLAVTGAPCGAAAGVIDCDRATTGAAAVSDVTIFYGEDLYVIVDGVGELAFDGGAAGPFTLTLRVEDPACGE